jgi:hypothetical protein
MKTFIGINEKNEPQIYVSPWELNPWGSRCEKGTPAPKILASPITDDNAMVALRAAAKYVQEAGVRTAGKPRTAKRESGVPAAVLPTRRKRKLAI